jgi:hypothetical protein
MIIRNPTISIWQPRIRTFTAPTDGDNNTADIVT